MKQKDSAILDAVGQVLREIFRKRDAERATLQRRVAALEEQVAELKSKQQA